MSAAALSYCTFKENIRVLDLAFEYLEIDAEKKEKVVQIIRQRNVEQSGINLRELFQAENLIPEDEVERLEVFDQHLLTIGEDRLFGEIVAANGFTDTVTVSAATQQQREYFEKYRINQTIGDILVENRMISQAEQVAVLLTQNRIPDEHLLAAFSKMGSSPGEKEAINKRFCAFAIKKEFVSIAQVSAAFEIRQSEIKEKKTPVFVGVILQETAGLSEEEIQSVLVEQKRFEKRRLDLEKALYNEKSEIKISKKLNRMFETHISKDGVQANVYKITSKENSQVPVYEFLIWLRRSGIQYGIVSDDEIEQFIRDGEKNASLCIAKGVPPVPCLDETVCFYFGGDGLPQPVNGAVLKNQSDQGACTPAEASPSAAPSTEKEDEKEADAHEKKEGSAGDGDDLAQTENIQTDKEENKKNGETEEARLVDNETDSVVPLGDTGGAEELTQMSENLPSDTFDAVQHPSDRGDNPEMQSDPNETRPIENPANEQTVMRGTLLAEIISGKEGKPGKDVMGRLIKPGVPARCVLNAGTGVGRKQNRYYAVVQGTPKLKNLTTLVVEPVEKKSDILRLTSPVSTDTQKRHENDMLEVFADITPSGVLKCHSLLLQGKLQGKVICQGPVEIRGEVGTDKKIKEDEVVQAAIFSRGDVRVSKSIRNAVIQTEGVLNAFHASVYGSHIIATKGVDVKNVVAGETGPSLLCFGLKPKDKMHALDHTIEVKQRQRDVLMKTQEISELTLEYEKALKAEKKHRLLQDILKNLVEIIDAPELFQHEDVLDKITYLKELPDYSSIKADYLRLPEEGDGVEFLRQLLEETSKMSLSEKQAYFIKKIDPAPDTEEEAVADPDAFQAQIQFDSRLALIEQEIAANVEDIRKIDKAIAELFRLRQKLVNLHLGELDHSEIQVKIKNKCEKGTIIKGRTAVHIVEKDIYNVCFKEVLMNANSAKIIDLPF